MAGPVLAGSARFALVAIGGYLLVRFSGASLAGLYALISVAMIVFGTGAAAAVQWRVFADPKMREPSRVPGL